MTNAHEGAKERFRVEPLDGRKYYGTVITNGEGRLEVWGLNKQGKPSERELALWDSNEPFEICDSHYEDAGDLEAARVIVKALNAYYGNAKGECLHHAPPFPQVSIQDLPIVYECSFCGETLTLGKKK